MKGGRIDLHKGASRRISIHGISFGGEDAGRSECYGRFSQINNAVRCGQIRQKLLRDAARCTRFLPYKDVIQVEFQSTQRNPVFCPMVPLKVAVPCQAKVWIDCLLEDWCLRNLLNQHSIVHSQNWTRTTGSRI